MPALATLPLFPGHSVTSTPCPICSTEVQYYFLSFDRLPVNIGTLYDSREEAIAADMGPVDLAFCPKCGFVQNRSYEPGRHLYVPGYEVQLVHSPLFAAFLGDLADRLIEKYRLYGKHIADIGCGPGHFLRLLCERGGNTGVGIDPTVPREGFFNCGEGLMELRRGFFSAESFNGEQFDLVVSQSVLEDILRPGQFIREMTRLIKPGGAVYVEVSNGWRALVEGKTWVVNYEMQNLFSLESLEAAATAGGLAITESGSCYQEQYAYVEGVPGGSGDFSKPKTIPGEITRMAREHAESVDSWTRQLATWRAQERRVMLWGSAGRTTTFLNSVPNPEVVEAVVDNNTGRQGLHLPGSGQCVLSPAGFAANPPDVLIISNPIYVDEIRAQVEALGVNCDFKTL